MLLKPAPGIHNTLRSLPSPFVSVQIETWFPALSRAGILFRYRHSSLTALPQRSSLRSGLYCVPVHQHLLTSSEPLTCTSQFPGSAGYTRSLGCAGAPRPPMSGSELSLLTLLDMSSSSTPEKSVTASIQFLRHQRWPSPRYHGFGFLKVPTNPFPVGVNFGASLQFACATTCRFVRSPDGSDTAIA